MSITNEVNFSFTTQLCKFAYFNEMCIKMIQFDKIINLFQLIYETIDQYFESPRDDIDLMLRISRNDMLPRLHIDLQPSNEVIAKENQRAETSLTSDYRLSSNHRSVCLLFFLHGRLIIAYCCSNCPYA